MNPEELKYCKTHEWLAIDGNKARLGITDYAQNELGDIVYVELPEVGEVLTPDTPFGVVESVKAVSDLFCPVNGTVLEINSKLLDNPELVNQDCFGEGWMLVVDMSDPAEVESLMSFAEYQEFLEKGAE